MNRVFSPFYPNDVCGVVYQNSNRHLACQFTFACDGIPDVVTEPDAWVRAKRIARDMLDGKLWMPEVAKATHYHAYWVHPDWVNEMKKIYKLGVHTFYRPLNWGDGSDEPTWGDAKVTQAEVAKEEQEGPGQPQQGMAALGRRQGLYPPKRPPIAASASSHARRIWLGSRIFVWDWAADAYMFRVRRAGLQRAQTAIRPER